MTATKNAFKILLANLSTKNAAWIPRLSWDENTKMNLKEMEFEDVNWADAAGCCYRSNEPLCSITVGVFRQALTDFSVRTVLNFTDFRESRKAPLQYNRHGNA